jgi:hypothetical protein
MPLLSIGQARSARGQKARRAGAAESSDSGEARAQASSEQGHGLVPHRRLRVPPEHQGQGGAGQGRRVAGDASESRAYRQNGRRAGLAQSRTTSPWESRPCRTWSSPCPCALPGPISTTFVSLLHLQTPRFDCPLSRGPRVAALGPAGSRPITEARYVRPGQGPGQCGLPTRLPGTGGA